MHENKEPSQKKLSLGLFLPFIIFSLLAILFFWQLGTNSDPSTIPSALLNKTIPEISLKPVPGMMLDGKKINGFDPKKLKSGIFIVNVWASWCVPCRLEHPVLMRLSQHPDINGIIGINYKNKPQEARTFLETLGNPYQAIGYDPVAKASIEWGVYGVPETFLVIDGIIRYKHVGVFTLDVFENKFISLIEKSLNPE